MRPRSIVHALPVWRERGDGPLAAAIPRVAGELQQWREVLWCRRLGDGRFELCCIPFWLPDLALGSVVRADTDGSANGADTAARLVLQQPSGRATLWALFDGSGAAERREPVQRELAEAGCLLEWNASLGVLAVDAATLPQAETAYALLQRHERRGLLHAGKTCVPDVATHRPLAAAHEGGAFIHAPLSTRWAPWRWERLSAREVAPARFRLTDTPFFAAGLARGDDVQTGAEPDGLAEHPVLRVRKRGGRLAVRLQIAPGREQTTPALLAEAGLLACGVEWYASRFAVLDAPAEAARALRALLDGEQARGNLLYEAAALRRRGIAPPIVR